METKWKLSFFLIVSLLGCLTYWNYNNRVYDWDMPGYLGCLYTYEFPGAHEKVKNITFAEIKKEAPPQEYNDVIGTKPYDQARQVFAGNTQAFTEQLPYFQIKAGYNLSIFFLYKLGIPSPMSVLLVSLISYFISGILMFYILKLIFPEKPIAVSILTIAVVILPPMTYMSRVSTPDMFIFQFLLIFIIGVIKKWNQWIMFPLLLIITFTRPDYIPFTLSYIMLLVILGYIENKKLNLVLFLQGGILLFLYLSIIRIYDYPGWKDLFFDSFIHRRPVISAQSADFGFSEYLHILFEKIIYFKKVTVISLSLLILIFYLSKDIWVRGIAILFFANIYIKFLFFPHSSGLRFFFGYIMLLFIIFLYALSKTPKSFKLNKIA